MPPIFKTLANAMQGKPLFDQRQQSVLPPSQPLAPVPNQLTRNPTFGQPQVQQPGLQEQLQPQSEPPHQESTINRADSRTFPVIRIKRSAIRTLNGQMEIRSIITNDSPFVVDLHRVEILGRTTDIRYPLRPRQEKEFLLYSGPCMLNNAYHDMDIEYKAETGAYFKAIHDIRYLMNSDRTLRVDELNLRLPIRLVAG